MRTEQMIAYAALVLLSGCLASGCSFGTEPIERALIGTDEHPGLMTSVIGPAVQKGIAETAARTTSLQGSFAIDDIGYEIDFEGFWVVGLKGKALVRVVGVNGEVMGSIQADQGPDLQQAESANRGDPPPGNPGGD